MGFLHLFSIFTTTAGRAPGAALSNPLIFTRAQSCSCRFPQKEVLLRHGRIGCSSLLRFWFTLDGTVDRKAYLASGVTLMVVKYFGDAWLVARTTGTPWGPQDYLLHVHSLLALSLPGAPSWLLAAIALWALPFIWIGVSLTLRRAIDAGLSPWLAVAFFVPFVNFVLMLVLVIAPSSPSVNKLGPMNRAVPGGRRLPTALLAIGSALLLAVAVFGLSTLLVKQYFAATIFGTPFAMGALAGFLFNRKHPEDPMDTIKVSTFLFIFTAGAFMLFAYDGAVCIFMAFPIAFTVGLLGAFFGRAVALCGRRAMPPAISAMLVLPVCIALELPVAAGSCTGVHDPRWKLTRRPSACGST